MRRLLFDTLWVALAVIALFAFAVAMVATLLLHPVISLWLRSVCLARGHRWVPTAMWVPLPLIPREREICSRCDRLRP